MCFYILYNLNPDLVLCDGDNEALLIDVTMPFESSADSFHRSYVEKVKKYTNLCSELKARFKKVSCDAIIVGLLGAWDLQYGRVVSCLCSWKCASLMKKLIVSDSIHASRDMFFEHITQVCTKLFE